MASVSWFTDSAMNTYSIGLQMMPEGTRLVKGASKEVNAIFSIVTPHGRPANFAGTLPNELRYYYAGPPASGPHLPTQQRLRVVPQ